jgi:hypothetical protein
MGALLRKYNTATAAGTHIRMPVIKAGAQDYALSADWTPAAGDVKLSKDSGAEANITTLPAFTNGAWEFQLTGAELTCKTLIIKVVDAATKAVEDQFVIVETYRQRQSAMYPVLTMSDAVRTFGLTALPNVASGSAGSLVTCAGTVHGRSCSTLGRATSPIAGVTHTNAVIPTVTTPDEPSIDPGQLADRSGHRRRRAERQGRLAVVEQLHDPAHAGCDRYWRVAGHDRRRFRRRQLHRQISVHQRRRAGISLGSRHRRRYL